MSKSSKSQQFSTAITIPENAEVKLKGLFRRRPPRAQLWAPTVVFTVSANKHDYVMHGYNSRGIARDIAERESYDANGTIPAHLSGTHNNLRRFLFEHVTLQMLCDTKALLEPTIKMNQQQIVQNLKLYSGDAQEVQNERAARSPPNYRLRPAF